MAPVPMRPMWSCELTFIATFVAVVVAVLVIHEPGSGVQDASSYALGGGSNL